MEQTQPSHSNSKLSNENSNKKNTDYWKLEQWKLISHMWTKKIAINIQIFAGWSLARFGKLGLINFTLVVRAPFTLDKPWYEVVFLIIQLILCEFKGKKNENQENIDLGVLFAENELKKIPIRKIPTHQTPPGKFLPRKFPHRKFSRGIIPPMFLNIPTRVFNFVALSQERLFCNSIFKKCWDQKFRSRCIKKNWSLPAQVL